MFRLISKIIGVNSGNQIFLANSIAAGTQFIIGITLSWYMPASEFSEQGLIAMLGTYISILFLFGQNGYNLLFYNETRQLEKFVFQVSVNVVFMCLIIIPILIGIGFGFAHIVLILLFGYFVAIAQGVFSSILGLQQTKKFFYLKTLQSLAVIIIAIAVFFLDRFYTRLFAVIGGSFLTIIIYLKCIDFRFKEIKPSLDRKNWQGKMGYYVVVSTFFIMIDSIIAKEYFNEDLSFPSMILSYMLAQPILILLASNNQHFVSSRADKQMKSIVSFLPKKSVFLFFSFYVIVVFVLSKSPLLSKYFNFEVIWLLVSFVVLIRGVQMQYLSYMQRNRYIKPILINYLFVFILLFTALFLVIKSIQILLFCYLCLNIVLLITNIVSVKKRIFS